MSPAPLHQWAVQCFQSTWLLLIFHYDPKWSSVLTIIGWATRGLWPGHPHKEWACKRGTPSLWSPTDTTSSGTWALGLLRLCRSLVHLTRNLARVISLLCFMVCESMVHYLSSLSCCLCPVIMLSQRAVTHWCPPAHRMVGPSFSQELGHHRMQPVSLRVWSDELRAGSRWLWQNKHVGM